MAKGGGSYQLGFQLSPLIGGELDTSGDFKGGPHKAEDDPLFKMAEENRDGGNKMVKKGEYEPAIGRYSEMIMQTRSLEQEVDIIWTDESRDAVRQLRAAAYLNLSLCFLKTEQWTHASNTATRALQGDKDPPDPKENVLTPEKKAKALFRRAQAQSQGFGNFSKAVEDLQEALKHTPDDKGIKQELARLDREVSKAAKAADKKLAGFLNKSSEKGKDGIFGEALRPEEGPKAKPVPNEPMKLSDGLWVMPGNEEKKDEPPSDDKVDYDELSREIAEMKEACPEEFANLREQVTKKLEEQIKQQEEEAAAAEANNEGKTDETEAKTEEKKEAENEVPVEPEAAA
mmetsp:Transcript_13760/g.30003  ORF Transcript_13760/g.30003 Transcript_13760/m.30003 type:complete len:344 (-) Transcript_13760:39-1070(-)